MTMEDMMMPKLVGEDKKVFWKHAVTIRIEYVRHDRDNVMQILLFNKMKTIKPLLVDLAMFGKKFCTEIEEKVNEKLPQPKFLSKNPIVGTEIDREVVRTAMTNELVMKFVLNNLNIQAVNENDEDQNALTMTLPEDILYTKPVLLLPFVDNRQKITCSFDAFATLRRCSNQPNDLPSNLRASVFFQPFCAVQERRGNIQKIFRRVYHKVLWMNALSRTKKHLQHLHVKMMKKKARQEMQKAKEKMVMEAKEKEDAKQLKLQQKHLEDRLEKLQSQQEQQAPWDRICSRRNTAVSSPIASSSPSSNRAATKSLSGLAALHDHSSSSPLLSARKGDSPSSSSLSARKSLGGLEVSSLLSARKGDSSSSSTRKSLGTSIFTSDKKMDASSERKVSSGSVHGSPVTHVKGSSQKSERVRRVDTNHVERSMGVSRKHVLQELNDVDHEDHFDQEIPVHLTMTLRTSSKMSCKLSGKGGGLRRQVSVERGLSDMLRRSEREDETTISLLSDKGYSLPRIDSKETGFDTILTRSGRCADRNSLHDICIHSVDDLSYHSQQDMISLTTTNTSCASGLPHINSKEFGSENALNRSNHPLDCHSVHGGSVVGLSSVVSTDSLLASLEREMMDSSSRTMDCSIRNMDVSSRVMDVNSFRHTDAGYSTGGHGGNGAKVGKAWSSNSTMSLDLTRGVSSTTTIPLDEMKTPRRLQPMSFTQSSRSVTPRSVTPRSGEVTPRCVTPGTPRSSPIISPVESPIVTTIKSTQTDSPRQSSSKGYSGRIQQGQQHTMTVVDLLDTARNNLSQKSTNDNQIAEKEDNGANSLSPAQSPSSSFSSPCVSSSSTSILPLHPQPTTNTILSPITSQRSQKIPSLSSSRPSLSVGAIRTSSKDNTIATARNGSVMPLTKSQSTKSQSRSGSRLPSRSVSPAITTRLSPIVTPDTTQGRKHAEKGSAGGVSGGQIEAMLNASLCDEMDNFLHPSLTPSQ